MTQCYRRGSINTPVPSITFKKVYTAAVNAPYAPPLVVVVYVVAVLAMFCAWVVMPNIWGLLVGQAVHGVMYAHMMVAIVTAEGAKNKSAELSSHLGAGQLLVVAMFLICAVAGVRGRKPRHKHLRALLIYRDSYFHGVSSLQLMGLRAGYSHGLTYLVPGRGGT